jgi:tetratricopeptide (TPR) repeat protein
VPLKRREAVKRLLREVDVAIRSESLSRASDLCIRALSIPGLSHRDAVAVKERLLEIALMMGEYEEASSILEEVRASAIRTGDRALVGRCHLNAGTLHMRRGALSQSEEHYRAAAYIFRWEVHEAGYLSRCYNNLGLLLKGRGEWRASLEFFSQALDACKETDDPEVICAVLLNRCILQRKLGLLADAWEGCLRGLGLSRDANLRLAECRYSLESAMISILREESELAMGHLQVALAGAKTLGYGRELAIAYELAGDLDLAGDLPEQALCRYGEALGIAKGIAERSDLVIEILRRIASAKLIQGDIPSALSKIRHAVEEARSVGDQWELGATLRVLGEIHAADGKLGLGIEALEESIAVMGRLSSENYELGISEAFLGGVLLRRGNTGDMIRARDHLLRARQIFGYLGWAGRVTDLDRMLAGVERNHGLFVFGGGEYIKTRTEEAVGRHGVDTGQYGLVTCDERIVGDIARWGDTEVRVLIEGETGVGKELVARTLHALSRRRESRFVAVDCGALSESLADSELFGHAKGSYTGAMKDRVGLIESAGGGTLLLDEIGELSAALQTKLLRVLETGEVRRVGENRARRVDIRLISATTKDLWKAVNEGHFRRDLYYRLKGTLIRVPALRERPGDIELLLDRFLDDQCDKHGREVRLSPEVKRMLVEYGWPGNVRELKSMVEAMVASSRDGAVIHMDQVQGFITESDSGVSLRGKLRETELEEIEKALAACNGNKTRAAKMLGINRKTLHRKIRHLNG